MGSDLHQPGRRHLPQLLPCAEIVRRQIRHEDDDGNAGLHAVFLQNGVHQIVIAAVAVIKGDEDGLFRQGVPGGQFPGQHRRIAHRQNGLQVGAELAGGHGHVIAVLPVRDHVVIHEDRQRLPHRLR